MTYSQGLEQEFIASYFKETGTFLDLGANDGITLSNTHYLANIGWSGICVEPSSVFEKLRELYKGNEKIQCLKYAVHNYDGEAEFYESETHLKTGDWGLLSTLKADELQRWKDEKFNKVMVDVLSFKSLLEKCWYSTFDFISIDCEGCDYDILSQINLEETGTKMVCVEFNQKDKDKYVEYCRRFGLELRFENYENLILCC